MEGSKDLIETIDLIETRDQKDMRDQIDMKDKTEMREKKDLKDPIELRDLKDRKDQIDRIIQNMITSKSSETQKLPEKLEILILRKNLNQIQNLLEKCHSCSQTQRRKIMV